MVAWDSKTLGELLGLSCKRKEQWSYPPVVLLLSFSHQCLCVACQEREEQPRLKCQASNLFQTLYGRLKTNRLCWEVNLHVLFHCWTWDNNVSCRFEPSQITSLQHLLILTNIQKRNSVNHIHMQMHVHACQHTCKWIHTISQRKMRLTMPCGCILKEIFTLLVFCLLAINSSYFGD